MAYGNTANAIVLEEDPRTVALRAIERRHGATIGKSVELGTYTVLDSFRRPEGIWWVRAVRRKSSETVQLLVVPSPMYTSLAPDAEIHLTKVVCGGCAYYEATQA